MNAMNGVIEQKQKIILIFIRQVFPSDSMAQWPYIFLKKEHAYTFIAIFPLKFEIVHGSSSVGGLLRKNFTVVYSSCYFFYDSISNIIKQF